MPNDKERTRGWGAINNSNDAHYFVESRSLCMRWWAFSPAWESNQRNGPEPRRGSGTCKTCWRKAVKLYPDAAPPEAPQ